MAVSVTLPALGESVTEGTVTRWLKAEGERVEADEPLLEVSTDKVDTEIPSPVAGVLASIKVAEDETVEVGAELAVIDDGTGAPAAAPAPAAEPEAAPAPEPAPAPAAEAPAAPAAAPEPAETPAAPAGGASGTDVVLPALGESVTEGTVTRWLKEVGEEVAEDEPLLEVSTDKVDTEIPPRSPASCWRSWSARTRPPRSAPSSPSSAPRVPLPRRPRPPLRPPRRLPLRLRPPRRPPRGSGRTARPGRARGPGSGARPGRRRSGRRPRRPRRPGPRAGRRGSGDPGRSGARRRTARGRRRLRHPAGAQARVRERRGPVHRQGHRRRRSYPQAGRHRRRRGREGRRRCPGSRSRRRSGRRREEGADARGPPLRGQTVKMPRIRKVIGDNMVKALHEQAQLSSVVEVDVTRLMRLRGQAKDSFAAREGVKLSPMPFFVKAAAQALKAHPAINARINVEDGTITYFDTENVGIAVDSEKGLMTPVIKHAGDLNIAGIAKATAELAGKVRANKITPDELSGATFTISNTGSRGALFDTIIVPRTRSRSSASAPRSSAPP